MATDTVTIAQFIADNAIAINSKPTDSNPVMELSHDMDHWKVTLSRTVEGYPTTAFDAFLNGKCIETVFQSGSDTANDVKRSLVNHDGYDPMIVVRKRRNRATARMTLTFSKGYGHHGAEPTAAEVLDCLASDAAGIENSPNFEDWCREYGYHVDSRKALKIFKACEHQAKRLRSFLGDDAYQQLLWNTERE